MNNSKYNKPKYRKRYKWLVSYRSAPYGKRGVEEGFGPPVSMVVRGQTKKIAVDNFYGISDLFMKCRVKVLHVKRL